MKDQPLLQLRQLRPFIAFSEIQCVERRELQCREGHFLAAVDRAALRVHEIRPATDLLWSWQQHCSPRIEERLGLRPHLKVVDGPARWSGSRCRGKKCE